MILISAVTVSLLIALRNTIVGSIQTEDAFTEVCNIVAVVRAISTASGILRFLAAIFTLTVGQRDAELVCIVRRHTADCMLTQRFQNGATARGFRGWRIDNRGVDTSKIRNQLGAAERTLMMMMIDWQR
jgi:hypothetical protein